MKHIFSVRSLMYSGLILLAAFWVSSSYRGIYADDLPRYIQWADEIYFQRGLDGDASLSNPEKSIASIFLSATIALAYHLVGHTLLAIHLFPLLFALGTPVIFFWLLRRITGHDLWSFFGALAYIAYPTNPVWLNEPFAEPIFIFWLIFAMLIVEYAKDRPNLLPLAGFASAFMITARIFDGMVFAVFTLLAVLYEHRKRFPVRQFSLTLAAFSAVLAICPILFGFSFIKYYEYFRFMLTEDMLAVNYAGEYSSFALTTIAAKSIIRWHFGGAPAAGVIVLLLALGALTLLKKNIIFPTICVIGYSAFLLFMLGGRSVEPLLMRLASKILPGMVILLVIGGKTLTTWLAQTRLPRKTLLSQAATILFFSGIAVISYQKNLAFFAMMSDILPSSSLWKIIKTNPPLPIGRQFYGLEFREDIYKAVLGDYRPSYRSNLAKAAWDADEPGVARQTADFSYYTTFADARWRQDTFRIEGNSPLWTESHPDRIGAFPVGNDGTVVYRFSFPQPAQTITLSDMHTQWETGDIVRLWVSENGVDWTLLYDDDIRYQKTYYHHVMKYDQAALSTFYVKYYFYAGDSSRSADDNRGASLEAFSLAVNFVY